MKHESNQPQLYTAPEYTALEANSLLTVLPIPNGRRFVTAVNFQGKQNRWRLLRNGKPLCETSAASIYDTVAVFDLTGPMLSGNYRVEVY